MSKSKTNITQIKQLKPGISTNCLNKFDYIIPSVLAIIAGFWIFKYIGTSIEWDDLFYMNVSQSTTPEAWVLNRYGHIYLQKLFMFMANDALTGAKIYWISLFFGTCIFVYWISRILSPEKGYINAFISVVLLSSFPLFTYYAGCTLADFTVMFLVTLACLIFCFYISKEEKKTYWLILLGLVFFWAVKSKETGICSIVLFVGLGFDNYGNRILCIFLREVKYVIIGMAIGCFLLMTLDSIFLHDFLFSIRPSNIARLFGYNVSSLTFSHEAKNRSYYFLISSSSILPVFIMYLLAGMQLKNKLGQKIRRKLIWPIPLVIILFLTVTTIKVYCGSYIKYLPAAFPVICVYAGQIFNLKTEGKTWGLKDYCLISSLMLVFLLVLLLFLNLPEIIEDLGWKSTNSFFDYIIIPISITFLLLAHVLLNEDSFASKIIIFTSLFLAILFPLNNNFTTLTEKNIVKKSSYRYEPYRRFANRIRVDKNVEILISSDIHKKTWMLGRDNRSHCWLFNVFFNKKLYYNNFIDGHLEDILKLNYDYAFITIDQWNKIIENDERRKKLLKYKAIPDKQIGIVFLEKNSI